LLFILALFFSGSVLAQTPVQVLTNLLSQEKDFNGVVLYAENGKTKFLKPFGFRNYNPYSQMILGILFFHFLHKEPPH
jgi:hypothetical protein